MDVKFYDSLSEGDSVKGSKLCMGLTGGDFWARIAGSSNLYRGNTLDMISFESLLAVSETNLERVVVPASCAHDASEVYYYVLRKANGIGDEAGDLNAVVKVAFDGDGELIETGCNNVFDVYAEQVSGSKVRLVWFYSPLGHRSDVTKFNIYHDHGPVRTEALEQLGSVQYKGVRVYSILVGALSEGSYKFCIGAEDAVGIEMLSRSVQIDVSAIVPEGVSEIQVSSV
ncbi:MAG: hypothetical protein KAJ07_01040 [Planctomycetes bacterium]|nr:hypothetical protein [Planctomycetota bacterium]